MSYAIDLGIQADHDLDILYDRQEVLRDDNKVTFFPRNPSANVTHQNYEQNPLPGVEPYTAIKIGLFPLLTAIKLDTSNGIEPHVIRNVLADSALILETEGGASQEWVKPITEFVDLSRDSYKRATAQDGQGNKADAAVLSLNSHGLQRLPEPQQLSANEAFNLVLKVSDSGDLPTGGGWDNSSQGGRFGFRAAIQVAKPPSDL